MNCVREYLFTWSDCSGNDNKASGKVYTAANRQMQRETFTVQSTGWRNCIMLNSWMCGNIQTFDSTVPFFFFLTDLSSELGHFPYKEAGFCQHLHFPLIFFLNHGEIILHSTFHLLYLKYLFWRNFQLLLLKKNWIDLQRAKIYHSSGYLRKPHVIGSNHNY